VVLLAVVALAVAGAALGHARKPVYQASASLSVGLLNLSTQSVPGFAVGGEVVAGGFSRAVQADAVVTPVARKFHTTPSAVRSRISSTPVPNSPIFTVTATGPTPGEAVGLANALSTSMVSYGRNRASSDAAFAALLARYRSAVRRLNRARDHVDAVRARASAAKGEGPDGADVTTTPAVKPGELAQARADLQTEQLRTNSLEDAYRSRAAAPGSGAVVQPLVAAVSATSDRGSRAQLYGAVGALAGLCLGGALAVLLMAVRHRRRRRTVA
jgi:hypothetical protein